MPPPVTHRSLLASAQRGSLVAQLDWLRYGRIEDDAPALQGLLSAEGDELLDAARRDHSYSAEEAALVPRQLAHLAVQAALLEVRPLAAQLLATPVPLGYATELPRELLSGLLHDIEAEDKGAPRDRALAAALDPLALRWVELRRRASDEFAERLRSRVLDQPVESSDSDPRIPKPLATPPTAPSPSERAARWLDTTDDATREMVRWLTRTTIRGGSVTWQALVSALRAAHFDGLARPSRRFYRLAEGARRQGFERELTTHMRSEVGTTQLAPRARVVALSAPNDIRVTQPAMEYGLVSDFTAAQAIGEGLALALVSPAQSEFLRFPCLSGVSQAFGMLYMQLRAEPRYLSRLEGHSPDICERIARHAGIFTLLHGRLNAALLLAENQAARSDRDRLEQLSIAVERALGCQLPAGLVALAFLGSAPQGFDFEAADCGLAIHAGLRERFDDDWYLNPRVSEVLRGACARGNLLSAREFCDELAVGLASGSDRALELLA